MYDVEIALNGFEIQDYKYIKLPNFSHSIEKSLYKFLYINDRTPWNGAMYVSRLR